jgi:aminoglycoside phosphotransferase (APT) family kinase protein
MTIGKMHVHEIDTDVSLVSRLITAQFPQWANLPISAVPSSGTDNALYRLGDEMVVRLPRIYWATGQVEKEMRWLPRLSPHLPLALPVPLAKGQPGEGFPYHWGVYRWLNGKNLTIEQIADPSQTAIELAQFITALQQIDTTGGLPAVDHNIRGLPLATRDAETREGIAALRDRIDAETATAVWETAVHAPEWNRPPVWFHGDMLPGNLLFVNGRLHAVIDFGGLAVGDPACDLMIAWGLFSGESRDVFRKTLAVDEATWIRGRGHTLSQAVIFIPYYLNTNPIGVRNAFRAIDEVLDDYRKGH